MSQCNMYYPRQYCRLCLSYRHSAAPSIRVSIAGCVSPFVLTVHSAERTNSVLPTVSYFSFFLPFEHIVAVTVSTT